MAQSLPSLVIEESTGSQVRIHWAETPDSLVLEETKTLGDWRPFPQIPTLSNGQFSVMVDVTGDPHYFRLHRIDPGGLPPDPASVAPPVPEGIATPLAGSTEFLYTGPNPIQTGVLPGAIDTRRAAVVRGTVKTRDNLPLSGVTVSILNHAELGQSLTRVDGMFDLAVNGGAVLTINYLKTGFLPAQRQVNAPWQDFVIASDVILCPVDAQVTTVTTDAPVIQVARGSLVNDSDGSRQATLLVPSGTSATMVMPDGSTQALPSLSVRATEYTVGTNGPNAMPAALPPTSGYTYAVELSADEVIAAGAKGLTFSQPLFNYVENFLAFPVGMIVPNGYYDRELAAWVPSDNGRVIKLTGESDGLAVVDTVGAGALPPVTLSDEERRQLALLYPVGQELWRVPIAHFTPWDHNWPYGPPDDAVAPVEELPEADEPVDDPCVQTGSSTIESENQILGETIGIVGTPFQLHYQSDRMPGRKTAYTLEIPLSGVQQLPASLRRIVLEIVVAGRMFTQVFGTAPNQSHRFTWDGKDAYGREVRGVVEATVRVGYLYGAVYQQPALFTRSFAAFSGISLAGNRARQEITIWKESKRSLGTLSTAPVGGWSLSSHHAYDPIAKMIHQGNGTRRSAQAIGPTITTVAGVGSTGFNGDGIPATRAQLRGPSGIESAPEGGYWIVESSGHRIRRVGPDGIISTFAGTGTSGFSGDGGPATQAQLMSPNGVAVAPDGSLYIVDGSHRVRRVGVDGIITTVAGSGTAGFSGDGGPATQAQLAAANDVEVAPDGSFYIADTQNYRIRRVGLDGIITTVAGTGTWGFSGDGGPATMARLTNPTAIAMAADGAFYISDNSNHRIRRVGPDGIITTVAGTSTQGFSGDGGMATLARLNSPVGLDVDSDGTIFISELQNNRIRRVGPYGIITTLAGTTGPFGFGGDGGPATQARFDAPYAIDLSPDGSLYVADLRNHRIRQLVTALPGLSITDFTIAAADGSELYSFDRNDRHIQTRNALTNSILYQFDYDAAGRLTTVTDGDGNVTTIQRDGSGKPTAIVGPFGQRTALTVNGDGYLSQTTSPAGENVQLTYATDGFLTRLTDPRGQSSSYTFDAAGRLTSATDPTGAVKTFARTGTNNDSTVTMSTALGRVTTYRTERLSNGDRRRTTTDPAGGQIIVVSGQNGTQTATYPDGTTVSAVLGPDPRWGMQAPLATSVVVTTPGGKVHTTTTQRSVTLTTPGNPLSLATMSETTTINGRAMTRVYSAATRTFTTTSRAGRKGTTVTDLLGKPVQRQFGVLAAMSLIYDDKGRLASTRRGSGASSRTLTLAYGSDGLMQSTTDAANRVLAFGRDANGRITSLDAPGGGQSHFTYDARGNLTTLTPPGQPAHRFDYTQNNQISGYDTPVVGAQNARTQYTYNADRQPLQIVRPDGQSAAIQHDTGGGTSLVDVAVGDTMYGYDANGRLASLNRDQGVALAYTYDGSLPTGTTWSGPVEGSIARVFDNNFRVTAFSVNGGNPVAQSYDLDGLLVQAGDLTLTRNALNGSVTGIALGTVTSALTYDSFGALATHTASQGGGAVYSAAHTRDPLGRLATRSETIEGVTHASAYSYDLAGRLSEVRQDDALIASYTYDGNGNRLSRTDSGGTTTATYDAQDRISQAGSTTYLHNPNGERLSSTNAGQTTSYQYDTLGNLAGVTLPNTTQIDYLLDGAQRRVGRKLNGALVQGFLYQDGLKPIAELDGTNTIVSRFVYSTGVNVPAYMIKTGITYRIITDHLGSPRLVIDSATGSVAQRMDYDEFGKVTLDSNPGFQPFGFAGGLYDRQSGLVHFGAREYDPETGRWTTRDPIGFRGGDANLYAYGLGDPVNRVDPTGLFFGGILDAILEPIPVWGLPCPPGSGEEPLEGAVQEAVGELIDDQVDSAVGGGLSNLGGIEKNAARFFGPMDTAVNAATTLAGGLIVVHESTREQKELIDTILTGSTVESDYAARKYYSPNGPRPCPPKAKAGPCCCGQ